MLLTFSNVMMMDSYVQKPLSVLASMFFHFERDNDFVIRYNYRRLAVVVHMTILQKS
jgi:hypothetical protein